MELQAKWIGIITDDIIGIGNKSMPQSSPAAYFRKEFTITKQVKNAMMSVTSLGIYQSYINGYATDEALFKPQWSDYNKHIDYNTFNVTDKIILGKNCIGAVVGDGWYSGKISLVGRQLYGAYPLELFMQLDIEYVNGEKEVICSDENFKAGCGKIRENDFQNGEKIDNRILSDNFSKVGYDDSTFKKVQILQSKTDRLKPAFASEIKYHEIFKAKFLHFDTDGKSIFDIGQNLAGNIKITLTGNYGDIVVARFGEMLKTDGNLYTENLRTALCTDTFILNGNGKEVFLPMFTFHGFRYIEIEKPKNVEIINLEGLACYSDLAISGEFNSDNAMVNQIFKNAFWGQKSNFVGLPTDCPQRDERMGWTGDSFAFCGSAMFNMDCRLFYKKYMDDLKEAIRENGAVTDVVPYVPIVGAGNNGWGDVVSELPYTYYKMYGDKSFLAEYIDCIKNWVNYLKENSNNLIRPFSGFGDWLSITLNETNVEAMNTALFAYSTLILAKSCKLLGDSDYEKYFELYNAIKKRYRETFIKPDGKIGNDNQGDYLLAYASGLANKEEIANNLIKTIERANFHLSCGFMSIKFLLPTLCDIGRSDLAYRLIAEVTYPSWGYSIKQGATTIWERWNSYTIENGFGNAEMNSFNHYSFGSCTEWLYRYVLGINSDESIGGFACTLIKPYVDFSGIIKYVKGSYNSVNGKIGVEWKVLNKVCSYKVTFENTSNINLKYDFSAYDIKKIKQTDNSFEIDFTMMA